MVTTRFFRRPVSAALGAKRNWVRLLGTWAFWASLLADTPVQARGTALEPSPFVLARVADKLLRNSRPASGAIVLLDVDTGRSLVRQQYARPAYRGTDLLDFPSAPAASLFKLVTASALLERRMVTPDTVVCYAGGKHSLEPQHLTAPPVAKRRCHPFRMALGLSINAIFARLASNHLTPSLLADTAQLLGFRPPEPSPSLDGDSSPPALVGAQRPTRIQDEELALHWGEAEPSTDRLGFARFAAGFQGSRLSVQGAAQLALLIARGGEYYRDPTGSRWRILRATTAQELTRMMEVTVHGGTSLAAFTTPYGEAYLGNMRVAGKTGTLRAGGGLTASWFLGFAPARSPEVALAVLLLNDSQVWRRKANEVGRDLLRVVFEGRPGVVALHQPYWDDDAHLVSTRNQRAFGASAKAQQ